MSTDAGGFPRRDAEGRVVSAVDLLGVGLAGLVIGWLALVVFDWGFALIGLGTFGRANGWLALLLPAWFFTEDFRAYRYGASRVAAAAVAAAVGLALGLLVAGLTSGLPPLASGGIAATVCTVAYAVIWFYGIRWLNRGTG